ncbi:MAG: hypothetical protein M3376_13245 [Actinomycetota bacterium]|nr:hypothetical protein [Actinomycetota bacterium]
MCSSSRSRRRSRLRSAACGEWANQRLRDLRLLFQYAEVDKSMFIFSKRPGRCGSVRFMPGCLVFSLVASIVLTILLNVIIRAS